MDDNKFWLFVWTLVAASLISFLGMIVASDWHEDNLRAEIVSKAANPMLAVCAFESNTSTSNSRAPYCTMYLSKGEK